MVRFVRPGILASTLVLVLVALACTDSSRTSLVAPSFSTQSANGHAYALGQYRLAQCATRASHENSALIGPDSGVLRVGPNHLVVPAGALNTPTLLTGEVLPLHVVNIEFGPEGLQFNIPARLTLNTTGCEIPASAEPSIVYVQEGQIVEVIPSTFDRVHHKITGLIHHFSGYSVAYADDQF